MDGLAIPSHSSLSLCGSSFLLLVCFTFLSQICSIITWADGSRHLGCCRIFVFVSLPLCLNIHDTSSHYKYSGTLREKQMLIFVSCVSFICVSLSVIVCVHMSACSCATCMGVRWHRSTLWDSNPSLTQGALYFYGEGLVVQ